MQHEASEHPTYDQAAVAAMLIQLNEQAISSSTVGDWAAESGVVLERIVAGVDLTYVRLEGHDQHRMPIVLMLLEGVWERAI